MAGSVSPQVGVLIVGHASFAEALLQAAETIVGPVQGAIALNFDHTQEDPRTLLSDAVVKLDTGAGVLILTDLFGGSPANIALALSVEQEVEVVTGANLPMVLRVLSWQSQKTLQELATAAVEYGQKQIMRPASLLGDQS